jgi:hypothetical protein
MLGIRYMKAPPTTFVLQYKSGVLKRSGAGLSFLYYAPTSMLVNIPVGSADVPFVFNQTTADFQQVTVQGQLTYRVMDPKKLAGLLDFSIKGDGSYVSDDPQKLDERLVNATQILTQAVVGRMNLRQALVSTDQIVVEVQARLQKAESVAMLGLEILALSVVSVKPTPEMARALEAEAREALSRQADQAIYDRRNAAVEQERRIKESELSTEIAVEEKKRVIRETQMAAEIAVEQQRAALIDQRVENERKDADARAYTLNATLTPLKTVDWKTLLAMSNGGTDPKLMIALAFRELAENATKIGEMNITPDLLQSLTKR